MNSKFISKQTKDVEVDELTDHINYMKLIHDLSIEVKRIITKGLAKDLIDRYSILDSVKYFREDGSQIQFVFQALHRCFLQH